MTPRRISADVLAGAASSAIAVLAAVAVVPLYLRYLGAEAFGVLGFILALQAAILALDAGLSISVARSVAQAKRAPALRDVASLVHGLSRAAWLVSLGIAAAIALASPLLAHRWLNLERLPPNEAVQSLILAGAAIGLRWPMSLYNGVLIGSQRLVALGVLNIVATLVTSAGAVALAASVSDLRPVVAWLAACGLAHVLACRRLALGSVGAASPAPRPVLVGFLCQAAAAGWLGLIGLLLMQVDKVVLSRQLPVTEFGYYVMASLMATSLYALVTPVFNVIYPQLARRADGDRGAFEQFYRRMSLLLAVLLFPIAAALGIFGESVLLLWTGDPAAASVGGPVVLMLAFGTGLHGMMFVPYALKLSLGASRLALRIGLVMLVFSFPVTILAAWRWGATGAAAGWLCLHVAYLLGGSAVTHSRLLPTLGWRWLMKDVGPPLLTSVALVGLAGALSLAWPVHQRAALAMCSVVACWALLAAASTRLRQAIRSLLPVSA